MERGSRRGGGERGGRGMGEGGGVQYPESCVFVSAHLPGPIFNNKIRAKKGGIWAGAASLRSGLQLQGLPGTFPSKVLLCWPSSHISIQL